MIKRPISKSIGILLGIGSVAVLAAGYTLLSYVQHIKNPKDLAVPTWKQMEEGVRSVSTVNPAAQSRYEDYKIAEVRNRAWDVYANLRDSIGIPMSYGKAAKIDEEKLDDVQSPAQAMAIVKTELNQLTWKLTESKLSTIDDIADEISRSPEPKKQLPEFIDKLRREVGAPMNLAKARELQQNLEKLPTFAAMVDGAKDYLRRLEWKPTDADRAAIDTQLQALGESSVKPPLPKLVTDSITTGERLGLGLGLSLIGALIIGVVMGCFPFFEAILLPPLAFLAKIPPTAALPAFMVLTQGFKTLEASFTVILVFGVLPPMAQTLYLSVREIPGEFFNKAWTLGARMSDILWSIVARFIMPHLLNAIRLAIGPAIVYLIAAEMLFADEGFGYRIRYECKNGMAVVYPYLAILAVVGFGADYGLKLLQRKISPWYVPEQE
jgi:NitT/TauT family transport system permease protein